MRCEVEGCKADLREPCGHAACRAHTNCSFDVGGNLAWHPDLCSVCWNQWSVVVSPSVSTKVSAPQGSFIHCHSKDLCSLTKCSVTLLMIKKFFECSSSYLHLISFYPSVGIHYLINSNSVLCPLSLPLYIDDAGGEGSGLEDSQQVAIWV